MKRRFVRLILAALVLAGVAVGLASWRIPTGAQAGQTLRGAARVPHEGETFRVASWNIHGGLGRDGLVNLDRLAERLRPFQFVGLNEVRGGLPWSALDQAQSLGNLLECGSLFLPFERRWGQDNLGNGVLSTCAVTNWLRVPLPHTRIKGHGNLTLVTVKLAGVPVRIIVTHIDRRVDHEGQFLTASNLFLSLAEPAILLGDMNATANDPRMAELLSTPGVHDALSPAANSSPTERIDWILVRGLESIQAGIEDTQHSDHPLVWAELRVTPKSPASPALSNGLTSPLTDALPIDATR